MLAQIFSDTPASDRKTGTKVPDRGAVQPGPAKGANRGDLIGLVGVSKRFSGGTLALENMSLTVRRGEFVALVGPSGCGKTTVLRLLAGLVRPTSGHVSGLQNGVDKSGAPTTGFVFQDPTLMPWASVLTNVALPLRLAHVSRPERQAAAREAIDLVGLSGFGDRYPRELSGGMKMRASIARALVTKPELLLMDEPFAALDEMARQGLNDELIGLWARTGATVVFVTHSVFEAVNLAQRVLVMSARPGRVAGEFVIDRGGVSAEEFRATPAYGEYCRRVSLCLASKTGSQPPGTEQ